MICPMCGRQMRDIGEGNYLCPSCEDVYSDDSYVEGEESLSVYDAAEIWESHGKDEDYMFGYSEDELERALRS